MRKKIILFTFSRFNYSNSIKILGNYKPIFSLPKISQIVYETSKLMTTNKKNEKKKSTNKFSYMKKYISLGLLTASSITYFTLKNKSALCKKINKEAVGQFIEGLPNYSASEISGHINENKRIWVTFKNGVYDITDFVPQHPGGNKILLAAGSSIEPFWSLYGVHNNIEIYNMLEEYRIGNISDSVIHTKEILMDPYEQDPKRHSILKALSVKPFNAEPPAFLLSENFYTPSSIFYVRNHLPVPEVDPEKYTLEIQGNGFKEKLFTLEDLKKFPKHTISAVIQCAGNRRSEMSKVKPVKGLAWNHGAIGNATWSGAKLTDVLESCGVNLNDFYIKHVHFEGLDKGPDNIPYAVSVPVEKALDPKGDVILAYEMNGEILLRDHGYPVRVIVPGVVGARNVKWLSKIILSDKESDSHWQQNDYKGFNPNIDWDTVDFNSAPAIQELPVISAICMPVEQEKVNSVNGFISVKGYAWSGGGKQIIRVDVSSDKGKTWHIANLEQNNDNPPRHWSWTLWSVNLPVAEENVEIWSKAVDSSYNTQPENMENIWNLRGVLSNSYHKINVKVSKI